MIVSRSLSSNQWHKILIPHLSTHSLRYGIVLGHHGSLPMDGTSRSRQTSLGCASGKLLALLPSSMAHGSRTILGVYAHHEAISTHAIPSPLSYSELSPSMVVRLQFYYCLQCDVHLCITIILLSNFRCMVSLLCRPCRYSDLQEIGTSQSQSINVSIDQHFTSPIQS